MTADAELEVLRAVADPTRLRILDMVAAGTHVTVTRLADALPMTRQAVTRHARALEEVGVLVGERDGREHRYRVATEPLAAATGWLARRAASWDDALGRLAAYVDGGVPQGSS